MIKICMFMQIKLKLIKNYFSVKSNITQFIEDKFNNLVILKM